VSLGDSIFWNTSLANAIGGWPLYLLAAFAIAAILTPLTIRIASRNGWLDRPGFRKVHIAPVPRLGGIAVFLAIWLSWGLFVWLNPQIVPYESVSSLWGLFFASSLIWLLGIYDDLVGANATQKICVQILAAVIVIYRGTQIQVLNNPFGGHDILVNPLWGWLLSIAWIVFITNAINLIDGLDGLATGVCMITSITIFFISKDLGRSPHLPYFSLVLAGSCAGFLIFNFSPARIFLGDSGSLTLGFLLASLSVSGTSKRSAAIVMFGPPIILALPMADVMLAIVRRLFRRRPQRDPAITVDLSRYVSQLFNRVWTRLKEVFNADQEHIHHALLGIGLSHRSAVILLYLVTMILGISAYSMALYSHLISTIAVFILLSFSLVWLRRKFRRSKLSSSEQAHL
jgi:UDP-GlcNAc:undecaprenyl-phosphate GlcNAc-1-phosphate transferase